MTFKNTLAAKRKRNLTAFRLLGGNLNWIEDNTPSGPVLATPSGTVDGDNARFFLPPPPPVNGIMVFNNGLYQYENTSYTYVSTLNFILFLPGYVPQPGDLLEVVIH